MSKMTTERVDCNTNKYGAVVIQFFVKGQPERGIPPQRIVTYNKIKIEKKSKINR